MTFKDIQGHYNCCYSIGRIQISFPASGLLLHLNQAPFPRYYVYVTACDHEKSFIF